MCKYLVSWLCCEVGKIVLIIVECISVTVIYYQDVCMDVCVCVGLVSEMCCGSIVVWKCRDFVCMMV